MIQYDDFAYCLEVIDRQPERERFLWLSAYTILLASNIGIDTANVFCC